MIEINAMTHMTRSFSYGVTRRRDMKEENFFFYAPCRGGDAARRDRGGYNIVAILSPVYFNYFNQHAITT